ncbi:hypothetical protein AOLI_G00008200 [Acnodon oligacanthus]
MLHSSPKTPDLKSPLKTARGPLCLLCTQHGHCIVFHTSLYMFLSPSLTPSLTFPSCLTTGALSRLSMKTFSVGQGEQLGQGVAGTLHDAWWASFSIPLLEISWRLASHSAGVRSGPLMRDLLI